MSAPAGSRPPSGGHSVVVICGIAFIIRQTGPVYPPSVDTCTKPKSSGPPDPRLCQRQRPTAGGFEDRQLSSRSPVPLHSLFPSEVQRLEHAILHPLKSSLVTFLRSPGPARCNRCPRGSARCIKGFRIGLRRRADVEFELEPLKPYRPPANLDNRSMPPPSNYGRHVQKSYQYQRLVEWN